MTFVEVIYNKPIIIIIPSVMICISQNGVIKIILGLQKR